MIYHGTDAQGRSVVTLYAHNSRILVLPVKRLKKAKLLQRAAQQAIQQVLTVILRFDLTVHV